MYANTTVPRDVMQISVNICTFVGKLTLQMQRAMDLYHVAAILKFAHYQCYQTEAGRTK
jgi:hypothetical protein